MRRKRQLVDNARIESRIVSDANWLPARLVNRVQRSRLRSFQGYVEGAVGYGGHFAAIPSGPDGWRPDVVLTVAHGSMFQVAGRFARKHGLPLVSVYHDWWPDIPDVPGFVRGRLKKQFLRLARCSTRVIGISPGMCEALGDVCEPVYIPPQPGPMVHSAPRDNGRTGLKICYFGNLSEYGPGVLAAAKAIRARSPDTEIAIFGPRPAWPAEDQERLTREGIYRGVVPTDRFRNEAGSCDAALVVMSFDSRLARRMVTSFPSKLTEAWSMGLPVVVWGPERCSAVRLVRELGGGISVTDPDPARVAEACERLRDAVLRERLVLEAKRLMEQEFNPNNLLSQFNAVLQDAVGRKSGEAGPKYELTA